MNWRGKYSYHFFKISSFANEKLFSNNPFFNKIHKFGTCLLWIDFDLLEH